MASEPADKTQKRRERRTAQRFKLRVTAEYRTTAERGKGLLWDISTSGARIDGASSSVTEGTHVQIQFSLFPGSVPIVLPAKVVRETKTGFAVNFTGLGHRNESLLRIAIPKAVAFARKK